MVTNQRKMLGVIILLIVFFITSIGTIRRLVGEPNSFADWLILAILVLLIGSLLSELVPKSLPRIKKITLGLTVVLLYLFGSSGILHFQGEGGFRPDLLSNNSKGKIDYYVDLHNGLNIPMKVSYVIPFGHSGLKHESTTVTQGTGEQKDRYQGNLTFDITNSEASLPNKVVVIYRLFHFIPMVEVINFRWAEI